MPQNKLDEEKSQLRACSQFTMNRIIYARQRAFANNKPCHTTQSVSEKVAELSKRLADPTDETARDDALVFLSYRYSSLPKQSILKLKTDLQRHDGREQMSAETPPDSLALSCCEVVQPAKKNVVNLTDRYDLINTRPGEEPLWYKIYIHSELGNYAQVR